MFRLINDKNGKSRIVNTGKNNICYDFEKKHFGYYS